MTATREMRAHWSSAETDEMLRLRAKGKTHEEIAEAIGRTASAVENRVHRLAHPRTLKPRGVYVSKVWPPERLDLLKRLWAGQMTALEIGKHLGASRNAVLGLVHRLGLPKRRDPQAPKKDVRRQAPRVVRTASAAPKANRGGGVTAATIVRRFTRDDAQPIQLREVATPLHARPWVEREYGECSWPIGEGADLLSCCAPTFRRGWCRDHFLIGTVPRKAPAEPRTLRRAA